ncbi:MarR family transcriptional regulator [Pandoraea nosoerga]|uniref:MarR family transcriptional regulator n=1 Tax=Pandoraea nosoerga TaxID=2508296 RepID=A0A5E4UI94_9BURK|nr:MarR family transcriptional regulator [Pandoraea nosoerga]MBN4664899.1 MarR family transcriptional regulator [Pandoraea nosoerga]MBN4673927.1 MarR family transcriptional regulator [Pandoraea nosoerga]MBN4680138.1 MarR family transcriptional regulator [Pandoraea nosoerga]MBN4744150.1 MarR family transcriptional regulator [Pandoraea nosoerga]VVD98768.1 MarR family transcriptional regulator [Pandoraea nosoerga]
MAVSNKTAPKTPVRLEDQLGFALYSAALAMTKAHKPMLDRLGLTYSQYLAMVVLWEQDGIAVNQLGARLGLDSGTLTPLLKRLESMGLLTRRRGEADERQVFIDLTPRGVSLRREARYVPAQVQAATGQSDAAQKTLRNLLLQLREALNDA